MICPQIHSRTKHKDKMGYRYSLFVNGKPLGPYERRMIVGMRVKKIVTDEQVVLRDDGLEMSVAQLLQDRDEATRPSQAAKEPITESVMGAPSTGMWPQFNVRFGGGPMKPGAFGFNGLGQISYQGDMLSIRGNRRNKNLGMSRQEERLPVGAIVSSAAQGYFVDFVLKPEQALNPSNQPQSVRIECATESEASELRELLNMHPGEMPRGLSFAKTASSDLL
jgi:hypothetical protein